MSHASFRTRIVFIHIIHKPAGAKIVEEPHETTYGEYQYAAEDLDEHHWLFSRNVKDRSPEEWGATVKRLQESLRVQTSVVRERSFNHT